MEPGGQKTPHDARMSRYQGVWLTLRTFRGSIFYDKTLNLAKEVKCIGVVLDDKLN